MKRKFLMMFLCFTFLLGAFSINAFAACSREYLIYSLEYPTEFIKSGFNSTPATVNFTSNGKDFTSITYYSSTGKLTYGGSEYITVYENGVWIDDNYRFITFPEPYAPTSYEMTNPNGFLKVTANIDYTTSYNHDYQSTVTNATCTDNGLISYYCSCGDKYDEVVEALGHSYSTVTKDVTCTENGYTTHTCSSCGDTYTENEVEALGHSYSTLTKEVTCTENGYTSHTCSTCGDTYTENEVEALGHSYSTLIKEATCTEGGYTTHTCSTCGDTYTENEVEALGHSFAEQWCTVCRASNPDYYVQSKDFSTVVTSMGNQIKVSTVVNVLAVVALACVGLVFMWWAVRKVISALMKAFRKGKISL